MLQPSSVRARRKHRILNLRANTELRTRKRRSHVSIEYFSEEVYASKVAGVVAWRFLWKLTVF